MNVNVDVKQKNNMKQIGVIGTHSFVDVITNSSTELFVCDTEKTIEAVKQILKNPCYWATFSTACIADYGKMVRK